MTKEKLEEAYDLLGRIERIKKDKEIIKNLILGMELKPNGLFSIPEDVTYSLKLETKKKIVQLILEDFSEQIKEPLKSFEAL